MVDAGVGLVDVLRAAGALVAVVALVPLVARVLRRAGRVRGSRLLAVEERLPLARGAHLAVVRCGSRRLLVGVTERAVSLVSPLEEAGQAPAGAAPGGKEEQPAGRLLDFSARLAESLEKMGGAGR